VSEIKTPPVAARHIPEKSEFQADCGMGRIPGSFRVGEPDSDREQTFWYVCPCGCGNVGPLTVGNGFKPDGSPTWRWNGSLDNPTLQPSVWWKGHWHGWLTDGVWKSC
jgi:hypothetical protein